MLEEVFRYIFVYIALDMAMAYQGRLAASGCCEDWLGAVSLLINTWPAVDACCNSSRRAVRRRWRQAACRVCAMGCELQPARLKGVALADRALREAGFEPTYPLRRGAVGEGVRHHLTLALLLQTVVADCVGGVQRLF